MLRPPRSTLTDTLFPDTTLFRTEKQPLSGSAEQAGAGLPRRHRHAEKDAVGRDRQDAERAERHGDDGELHGALGAEAAAAPAAGDHPGNRRPAERRVGKECVSTSRSRWPPYHSNPTHPPPPHPHHPTNHTT